ncbi:MAG: hypothetical protein ABI772_13725 [Bacteroidota bacterium]
MKKIIFLLLVICSRSVYAQEFAVDQNVFAAGIGFGGSFGSYNYGSQTPAISLQYERGIWPIDGPGVISLGGYVGFKSYKYEQQYSNFYYKHKWSYTIIGLRSAYHYTGLEVENLDVYGGLMLSYNIVKYKYTTNDGFDLGLYKGNYGSTVGLTVYVGGRYYLTDNIAGFMELGYGVSFVNLGLAFRFQ